MIHDNMRRFIIRTDAGGEIGFGHAMRSVSLAKHLRDFYGIKAIFYSNPYDKLENLYQSYGFQYVLNGGLSEAQLLYKIKNEYPGAVLFIDKLYPYDRETIRSLRNGLKIIMFQNECEGMFESHFAIFPSAHLDDKLIGCKEWLNTNTKFCYGPDYVIINDKLTDLLDSSKKSAQHYMSITTGASDPHGILIRLLEWLNKSDIDIRIRALIGFDFCQKDSLECLMPFLKSTIEVKEFSYVDLLGSYLAVCSFGVTTYELIFAGVPIITIGHAKKNSDGSYRLEKRYGCNYHLGLFQDLTKDQFLYTIQFLWDSEKALRKIKEKQRNLIDGKGINRVGSVIFDCCNSQLGCRCQNQG